jgi:hypothetical protein
LPVLLRTTQNLVILSEVEGSAVTSLTPDMVPSPAHWLRSGRLLTGASVKRLPDQDDDQLIFKGLRKQNS